MRSQGLDTQRQLLRFHCFETLEGDDIVLVHGQKMSTDARKKLIERQTTKMSTEERRHGDTETRRHVHINRVESSYGTKAPRGDKFAYLHYGLTCVTYV